jgi:hypothetical protein
MAIVGVVLIVRNGGEDRTRHCLFVILVTAIVVRILVVRSGDECRARTRHFLFVILITEFSTIVVLVLFASSEGGARTRASVR